MKKIISLAIVCCLFATSLMAQSKTAYFMDGYNYRHELNPAASPYRGYINLMGHYAIGVNSNLSATQFLYPNTDGSELYTFLHPEVSASDFLNKLHDNNILGLNTDIDIFGFGFNARRGYFSFDTKLHVGLSSNLPKELFAFLKQGMSSDHTVYDIRNFNVSASAYASAGIGYAYDLFDNLRIGVKAKYLIGLAAANANIDQMRVDMSSDAWTVNTQATMSAYGHGLRPLTGTIDENGNEVPDGDIGELAVKGPGVMDCYYKNPEATAEILKDGWLYTGDMAKKDEDGFIYLVDRKKDVVISGGENIYPVQIEDALRKHEKIKDVAVIGLPDARLGEIVAAIIEIKEGLTCSEDEINEFCKELPRYRRPKKIIFAQVPRNPTGKIEKPALRKKYCPDGLVEAQINS